MSAKQPTPTKSHVELEDNCTVECCLFIISCSTNFMLVHVAFKVCSPLLVKSLDAKVRNFFLMERFLWHLQVLGYMGQLEFFYDQVPDGMETIGTALFTSNTGVAHFLCTFILQIITSVTSRGGRQPWIISNINESRLDKYYWLLSTLSLVNFMAFFAVSMWYTYKTTERNAWPHKAVPEEPPIVE